MTFERPVEPLFSVKSELDIALFWNKEKIFEKSVSNREGGVLFRFLEGPPTANGLPHLGSVRTRIVKDAVLRYMTMSGYYVPRSAGWDTHGLPVELEVQKELGMKTREDVEKFGIREFAEKCRQSVFKYENEWKKMSSRIGFWLDFDHPYITLEESYIESEWWSLKTLYDKGKLYQGFKVVPYCPRDETPLSSHEVAQGYEQVDDPSVFVLFPLLTGSHAGESLVVWTTTPWTLPSNVAAAVRPDSDYVSFDYSGKTLICLGRRLPEVAKDAKPKGTFKGSELLGASYEPPFSFLRKDGKKNIVVAYEDISETDGSGIVHMAPAFGAEDYEVCLRNGLVFFQPVDSRGRFTAEVPDFQGEFVKDTDKKIIARLRAEGKLFKQERIRHTYPFCWRCGSPLLYYAWPTWFVRTTSDRDKIISLNREVKWYPPYIGTGRFGEFLDSMVDWALSRNRFWGTPLPVWVCKSCKSERVIGSVQELLDSAVHRPERLELHRPAIDEFVLQCAKCGGEMRRVTDVIDVWYDSGSASFSRFHYPFQGKDEFKKKFPVDFITEGVDQTRGWFYSLHVLGSMLFDQVAYRSCLVIGLVTNEKGEKLSKSEKNYVDPNLLIDKYGADPLRWHMLGAASCWDAIKVGENGPADAKRRFFNILENCVSFFLTYAEIDGYEATTTRKSETSGLSTLDKWALSRLSATTESVRKAMEAYEFNKAVSEIENFVVNDISQWYIRRSRRRFWSEEMTPDKLAAYATLHQIFVELSKLLAPLAPFSAESMFQRLNGTSPLGGSVHLCDYPVPKEIDSESLNEIEHVRKVVEAVRTARSSAGIRTRQPLLGALIFCDDETWKAIKSNEELITDEVNLRGVERIEDISKYMVYDVEPDLAAIGKRFRGESRELLENIAKDGPRIGKEVTTGGISKVKLGPREVEVSGAEIHVKLASVKGYSYAQKDDIHVFVNTDIRPELEMEWIARELIRRIQLSRKQTNLRFDDEISTLLWSEDERVKTAARKLHELLSKETLSREFAVDKGAQSGTKTDVDGIDVWIKLQRVSPVSQQGRHPPKKGAKD